MGERHLPAVIRLGSSIPALARSLAIPTRGEWPLKLCPSPAFCAALLMRLDIWFGRSPKTLSVSAFPSRIKLSAAMVGADTNVTDPWPSASAALRHVIQQAVPHGPDHDLLLRIQSQLVLYAVDGVPDGHGAIATGLGDLGV